MPDEYVDIADQLELLQSITIDDTTGQDKVDALWRQLMVYKSFGDTDLSEAKAKRAQAEASREQAQMEAIRTTQLLCARLRADAELELQAAEKVKIEAERTLQSAQSELERANEKLQEIEGERDQILADAQSKSQSIIDGANEVAKREITELRRHALREIKAVLNRVENMKATATEELETQRILTNISKIKATSRWLLDDESDGSSSGPLAMPEAMNQANGGSSSQQRRASASPRRSAGQAKTSSK